MTSDTTRTTTRTTTSPPDDVTELVAHISVFGPWALLGWRPRGGFVHPHEVDLRAVQAGLRRLL